MPLTVYQYEIVIEVPDQAAELIAEFENKDNQAAKRIKDLLDDYGLEQEDKQAINFFYMQSVRGGDEAITYLLSYFRDRGALYAIYGSTTLHLSTGETFYENSAWELLAGKKEIKKSKRFKAQKKSIKEVIDLKERLAIKEEIYFILEKQKSPVASELYSLSNQAIKQLFDGYTGYYSLFDRATLEKLADYVQKKLEKKSH